MYILIIYHTFNPRVQMCKWKIEGSVNKKVHNMYNYGYFCTHKIWEKTWVESVFGVNFLFPTKSCSLLKNQKIKKKKIRKH